MDKPMFVTTVKSGVFLEPPPEVAALLGLRRNGGSWDERSTSRQLPPPSHFKSSEVLYSFASRPRLVGSIAEPRTPPNGVSPTSNRVRVKRALRQDISAKNGTSPTTLAMAAAAAPNAAAIRPVGGIGDGGGGDNTMYDRRVARGSNFASTRPLPHTTTEQILSRQAEARRRAAVRQRAQIRARKLRCRTPPPVDGRKHGVMQTDRYESLEQLVDGETDKSVVGCQVDLLVDEEDEESYTDANSSVSRRPMRTDVATQLNENDLPPYWPWSPLQLPEPFAHAADHYDRVHTVVADAVNKILRDAIAEINVEMDKFLYARAAVASTATPSPRNEEKNESSRNGRDEDAAVLLTKGELCVLLQNVCAQNESRGNADYDLNRVNVEAFLDDVFQDLRSAVTDAQFLKKTLRKIVEIRGTNQFGANSNDIPDQGSDEDLQTGTRTGTTTMATSENEEKEQGEQVEEETPGVLNKHRTESSKSEQETRTTFEQNENDANEKGLEEEADREEGEESSQMSNSLAPERQLDASSSQSIVNEENQNDSSKGTEQPALEDLESNEMPNQQHGKTGEESGKVDESATTSDLSPTSLPENKEPDPAETNEKPSYNQDEQKNGQSDVERPTEYDNGTIELQNETTVARMTDNQSESSATKQNGQVDDEAPQQNSQLSSPSIGSREEIENEPRTEPNVQEIDTSPIENKSNNHTLGNDATSSTQEVGERNNESEIETMLAAEDKMGEEKSSMTDGQVPKSDDSDQNSKEKWEAEEHETVVPQDAKDNENIVIDAASNETELANTSGQASDQMQNDNVAGSNYQDIGASNDDRPMDGDKSLPRADPVEVANTTIKDSSASQNDVGDVASGGSNNSASTAPAIEKTEEGLEEIGKKSNGQSASHRTDETSEQPTSLALPQNGTLERQPTSPVNDSISENVNEPNDGYPDKALTVREIERDTVPANEIKTDDSAPESKGEVGGEESGLRLRSEKNGNHDDHAKSNVDSQLEQNDGSDGKKASNIHTVALLANEPTQALAEETAPTIKIDKTGEDMNAREHSSNVKASQSNGALQPIT